MNYTPTLQVSARLLDLPRRAPAPGPPVWVTKRGVSSPLEPPALTRAARRIGVGPGPDLSGSLLGEGGGERSIKDLEGWEEEAEDFL